MSAKVKIRKYRPHGPPTEDHFKEHSTINPVTGCWEWTRSYFPDGYGQITFRGRSVHASRVSYITTYGEIPNHLNVCHHCDNPKCVNPDHLFLGTQKDNVQDMLLKKRRNAPKGSKHWNVKLTPEQVKAILQDTRIHRLIANHYGVTRRYVCQLKAGERWKTLV